MDWKRVLMFVKPHRYLIVGATLSLIIFTNLGLLLPWILKIIIDRVLGSGDLGYLYALLGTILLIYAIREIFFYMSHFLTFYAAQRILFDVRTKLYKHLQSLSLRFYEEYRTGKLISNILTDVSMLQQMISASLVSIVVNLLMITCIMMILFLINSKLALVCLVLIPMHYLNFTYFKGHIKSHSRKLREMMSEISANLAETINGVKIVKSFAKERSESRGFVSQLRPAFNKSIKVNMMGVYCWMIAEVISVSCLVAVIGIGGYQVTRGMMTVGEFVAFYSYLGMLINPINQLSGLSTVISQGLASGARVMNLLERMPEIKECENPIRLREVEGRISFENVTFGYGDKNIINDFNLEIESGQKVALVGPSGSGKSTVASLALRFYDVNSGCIRLDGQDLRKLSTTSFRDHVAVVLQESFLFSGTIKDNIRYGCKEATDMEVIAAAKKANVHEFVENLEEGYDTEVGENGTKLSGGQKQRLAIARAILKNPEVLILDEATSSLDTMSEYIVQEALDNLMEGKTTIIIAHRLSTIRNADLIVVMENGYIKQLGNHQQLMREKGLYQELYRQQEQKKTGKKRSKSENKLLFAA